MPWATSYFPAGDAGGGTSTTTTTTTTTTLHKPRKKKEFPSQTKTLHALPRQHSPPPPPPPLPPPPPTTMIKQLLRAVLCKPRRSPPALRIGAYNVKSFGVGKARRPRLLMLLAEVISGYDVLSLLEIRDRSHNHKALQALLHAVRVYCLGWSRDRGRGRDRDDGHYDHDYDYHDSFSSFSSPSSNPTYSPSDCDYDYVLSPRLGRNPLYQEQVAVFYRKNRLKLVQSFVAPYDDDNENDGNAVDNVNNGDNGDDDNDNGNDDSDNDQTPSSPPPSKGFWGWLTGTRAPAPAPAAAGSAATSKHPSSTLDADDQQSTRANGKSVTPTAAVLKTPRRRSPTSASTTTTTSPSFSSSDSDVEDEGRMGMGMSGGGGARRPPFVTTFEQMETGKRVMVLSVHLSPFDVATEMDLLARAYKKLRQQKWHSHHKDAAAAAENEAATFKATTLTTTTSLKSTDPVVDAAIIIGDLNADGKYLSGSSLFQTELFRDGRVFYWPQPYARAVFGHPPLGSTTTWATRDHMYDRVLMDRQHQHTMIPQSARVHRWPDHLDLARLQWRWQLGGGGVADDVDDVDVDDHDHANDHVDDHHHHLLYRHLYHHRPRARPPSDHDQRKEWKLASLLSDHLPVEIRLDLTREK